MIITLSSPGHVERVTAPRWAKLGRDAFRENEFVVELAGHRDLGGFVIPTRMTAGYRRDRRRRPFIRQQAVGAVFH